MPKPALITAAYVLTDSYGHRALALERFGRDLASALDMPVDVPEGAGSSYPAVRIDCGSDLTLGMRAHYGAKTGKVEVWADTGLGRNLYHTERPTMPSATVDSARPMEAIARDITRRVIEPARVVVEQTRAKAGARRDQMDELKGMCADLMKRFPGLSLATPEPTHPAAHVYYNANGCYLTGTLHLDGHLAIQRFSIETPQQAEALFALIDGRADRDL